MSLALHDGLELRAEQTWHTANNHTAELAPALRVLLERCEVTLDDLTALAVCSGPGSYTGLRIGVSLAKGIASVHNLPLIGVTTLDTLAAAHPYFSGHALVPLVEAGRGRVIAATYHWRQGTWTHRGDAHITNWQALLQNIDGPAYLTGDIDPEGYEAIREAQAQQIPVKLTPAVYRLRRSGFLAEVALARMEKFGADHFDPALLVPEYVQSKDIPS